MSTKLLLHFDNQKWTVYSLDTAQYKFGSSSFGAFTDNGAWTGYFPEMVIGTSAFTIEMWFRLTSVVGEHYLWDSREQLDHTQGFGLLVNGNVLEVRSGGSTQITGTTNLSINTWYHVAVCGDGTAVKLWLEGAQEGSTWTTTYNFSFGDVSLGIDYYDWSNYLNGWIDEFRWSNSTRYTGAFTPSTSQFTVDANTVALVHFDGPDGAIVCPGLSGAWTADGATGMAGLDEAFHLCIGGVLDTDQKKFGTASSISPATFAANKPISVTASDDFAIGTKDFCIEAWIRYEDLPTDQYTWIPIIYQYTDDNNYWSFQVTVYDYTYLLEFRQVVAGVNNIVVYRDFGVPVVDTWYHVVVSRESNTYRLFVSGVKRTTQFGGDPIADTVNSESVLNTFTDMRINGINRDPFIFKWPVAVNMDEFRLSVGNARYIMDYTPPIAAYADILAGPTATSETIADGFELSGSTPLLWSKSLLEDLVLPDTVIVGWFKSIADSWFIYDGPRPDWHVLVPDTFDASDIVTKILGLLIPDVLTLTPVLVNMWHGTEELADVFGIYDTPSGPVIIYRSIDDSLVTTDATTFYLSLMISEWLWLNENISPIKINYTDIAESLTIEDVISKVFEYIIAEALSSTDSVLSRMYAGELTDESLVNTDVASFVKTLNVSSNSALTIKDEIEAHFHLFQTIYEALNFEITVELSGEIYECWVLNTPKFMPSIYSGYDFNSYCVFNNRAFGANDTGIFELTGDTDAGADIHTGVILSATDFNSPNQKRFRRGYLGISGTTPLLVCETEDGVQEAYSIDSQGKTVISSDLKSKKWKISVADFDSLDHIKLIPVILTK